jgi:hypothetical protein
MMNDVEIIPQDALEQIRRLQGEDPLTGVAPVQEIVFDMEVDLSEPKPPQTVFLSQMSPEDAARRIGRIPCEALYWILVSRVRPKWWLLEWEVILEELVKAGFFLDAGGHAKVMALWTILRAPIENNPYYRRWDAFLFLTCALMGRPLKWGEISVPTPVEIALSMHICLDIKPQGFSDQVLGTVASCCLYHGMWTLTGILSTSQEIMYQHLTYHRIPLGPGDVQEIRSRMDAITSQGKTSDDAPSPDDPDLDEREEIRRVQVIRCLDFSERFEALYARGEAAQEAVLEHHKADLSFDKD